jgi:hypothetical protein
VFEAIGDKSAVPYRINCQLSNTPAFLLFDFAAVTSKVHVPLGGSPQKCTERKGQLSKALSVLSLGLGNNSEDLVPIGEIRTKCRDPRGLCFRVTLQTTCSNTAKE